MQVLQCCYKAQFCLIELLGLWFWPNCYSATQALRASTKQRQHESEPWPNVSRTLFPSQTRACLIQSKHWLLARSTSSQAHRSLRTMTSILLAHGSIQTRNPRRDARHTKLMFCRLSTSTKSTSWLPPLSFGRQCRFAYCIPCSRPWRGLQAVVSLLPST